MQSTFSLMLPICREILRGLFGSLTAKLSVTGARNGRHAVVNRE
jgi:hypothetical protein